MYSIAAAFSGGVACFVVAPFLGATMWHWLGGGLTFVLCFLVLVGVTAGSDFKEAPGPQGFWHVIACLALPPATVCMLSAVPLAGPAPFYAWFVPGIILAIAWMLLVFALVDDSSESNGDS